MDELRIDLTTVKVPFTCGGCRCDFTWTGPWADDVGAVCPACGLRDLITFDELADVIVEAAADQMIDDFDKMMEEMARKSGGTLKWRKG